MVVVNVVLASKKGKCYLVAPSLRYKANWLLSALAHDLDGCKS